ncbi:hypothetical protein Cylst_1628 [Cylindrospermum stagnale PCC 7417]|uniref:Uncharacterized protein n=1 Tax=Cylindrospermum stagnale PCC 7417 TaxID=56107 RepID=K9WVT0_9NOST|nr:hypothetical protein Cylst_1628 [Cylindrospermum stagnale PCC 7417]
MKEWCWYETPMKNFLTSYYRVRTQTGGRHNTCISTIIEYLDGKFSIRITRNI